MKFFPENAATQLEFGKIKELLGNYCQSAYAKNKAENLRIHTRMGFAATELQQSHEYHQLLLNSIYFPNDHALNLSRELKLLSVPGAVLNEEELVLIRKLTESIEKIFRWFDNERREAYPALLKKIGRAHV